MTKKPLSTKYEDALLIHFVISLCTRGEWAFGKVLLRQKEQGHLNYGGLGREKDSLQACVQVNSRPDLCILFRECGGLDPFMAACSRRRAAQKFLCVVQRIERR